MPLDIRASDPELRLILATLAKIAPGAYLVGGAVRDLLSSRPPSDLDVVVPGNAHAAAQALGAALGASLFPLDDARGQYRVVLPDGGPIHDIDISPLTAGLEDDLARRDFTINAMAALIRPDDSLGELIDPCGGVTDLERKQVRMLGEQALRDDSLRLLRAARFATELDFAIEPATADAIRDLAPTLADAAPERQRDELVHILASSRAGKGMRLLDDLGLLKVLIPELMPARGVDQPGGHHYWDVFDHSLETLAALDLMLGDPTKHWLAGDFQEGLSWYPVTSYLDEPCGGNSRVILLKLAALLHDVAKPETKTLEPDGRARFFRHPEIGARHAQRICERLRFGSKESRFVALLVDEHLRPTQLAPLRALPGKGAIYRFFRDLDDAAPACLFLCLADGAAAAGPTLKRERWRGHVAYMNYVLEQVESQAEVKRVPRLVTGHDVMASLSLPPGPEIGRIMAALDEAIATGQISSRDEAIDYARRILAAEGS
jgi:poly(A) polymerase